MNISKIILTHTKTNWKLCMMKSMGQVVKGGDL